MTAPLRALIVLALLGLPCNALARDHFVAPPGAAVADPGDGSRAAPWAKLNSAFHTAQAGDRLVLLEGEYGDVVMSSRTFAAAPLTIVPERPGAAHMTSLKIQKSHNIVFQGLSVWPTEHRTPIRLISTHPDASAIRFEQIDVRGGPQAESYMEWEKADWTDHWRHNGVFLQGADNALVNSRITATAFAITADGPRVRVEGNLVRGFSGDALRGLGDEGIFRGNRVQDCISIDGNHHDGFQSWSTSTDASGRKVVDGMLVEGNAFLEWTGQTETPFRCDMQGIGLFDGIYKDFVIRNNLVVVTGYHGISVYGAQDSEIVNNTVLAPGGQISDRPWILLRASKQGVDPGGNTLANNIAMQYRENPAAVRRNIVARYPARLFLDVLQGDFRPKAGSGLIDTADQSIAPPTDITGRSRAGAPDYGAFEGP